MASNELQTTYSTKYKLEKYWRTMDDVLMIGAEDLYGTGINLVEPNRDTHRWIDLTRFMYEKAAYGASHIEEPTNTEELVMAMLFYREKSSVKVFYLPLELAAHTDPYQQFHNLAYIYRTCPHVFFVGISFSTFRSSFSFFDARRLEGPLMLVFYNGEMTVIPGSDMARLNSSIQHNLLKIKDCLEDNPGSAAVTEQFVVPEKLIFVLNGILDFPVVAAINGPAKDLKCEMSKLLLEILESHFVIYKVFDINTATDLQLEALKFGNKNIKFPQLFINGTVFHDMEKIQQFDALKELKQYFPHHCSSHPIRQMLHSSYVVAMINGTKDEPAKDCDDSIEMIRILTSITSEFKVYDVNGDSFPYMILQMFAKFPTYPVLFINGKLIGNMKKVKQLYATEELNELITRDVPEDEKAIHLEAGLPPFYEEAATFFFPWMY